MKSGGEGAPDTVPVRYKKKRVEDLQLPVRYKKKRVEDLQLPVRYKKKRVEDPRYLCAIRRREWRISKTCAL